MLQRTVSAVARCTYSTSQRAFYPFNSVALKDELTTTREHMTVLCKHIRRKLDKGVYLALKNDRLLCRV